VPFQALKKTRIPINFNAQHLLGTTSVNVMLYLILFTNNQLEIFHKAAHCACYCFSADDCNFGVTGMKVICAADVHDLCHSLPNEKCTALGKKNFGR